MRASPFDCWRHPLGTTSSRLDGHAPFRAELHRSDRRAAWVPSRFFGYRFLAGEGSGRCPRSRRRVWSGQDRAGSRCSTLTAAAPHTPEGGRSTRREGPRSGPRRPRTRTRTTSARAAVDGTEGDDRGVRGSTAVTRGHARSGKAGVSCSAALAPAPRPLRAFEAPRRGRRIRREDHSCSQCPFHAIGAVSVARSEPSDCESGDGARNTARLDRTPTLLPTQTSG